MRQRWRGSWRRELNRTCMDVGYLSSTFGPQSITTSRVVGNTIISRISELKGRAATSGPWCRSSRTGSGKKTNLFHNIWCGDLWAKIQIYFAFHNFYLYFQIWQCPSRFNANYPWGCKMCIFLKFCLFVQFIVFKQIDITIIIWTNLFYTYVYKKACKICVRELIKVSHLFFTIVNFSGKKLTAMKNRII